MALQVGAMFEYFSGKDGGIVRGLGESRSQGTQSQHYSLQHNSSLRMNNTRIYTFMYINYTYIYIYIYIYISSLQTRNFQNIVCSWKMWIIHFK